MHNIKEQLLHNLFCCEKLLRCCVTLKSANGFILAPFLFVLCGEIGSRGFGVLFPPLPCYSAVRWYVLLKLKAAVKTGYWATALPTITGI